MTVTASTLPRLDALIAYATRSHDRLVGVALLRVILGVAGVMYYLSDYRDRDYLWGPRSYDSLQDAAQQLQRGSFSLYLFDESELWFQVLFHVGLVVAVAFTIRGGRLLTALHAVLLWSLYLRNQDILEGGDNLARILLIFMVFAVSDAYFAPGARRRRARLLENAPRREITTMLHNGAVTAMLVQIAVLYFMAGYLKATASMWTNGTAMYYVSHIHQFSMFSWYPHLMGNVYVSWAVDYFTIVFEIAVPFVIWSRRAAIREFVTVALAGMHIGIMVCMGLVAFGLIMIGADSMVLTDQDYRTLVARVRRVVRRGSSPEALNTAKDERRELVTVG